MSREFNRDNLDIETARELALHNARTLGGRWVIWGNVSNGLISVTCPELSDGQWLAYTSFAFGNNPQLVNVVPACYFGEAS